jgi:hypothetical protein
MDVLGHGNEGARALRGSQVNFTVGQASLTRRAFGAPLWGQAPCAARPRVRPQVDSGALGERDLGRISRTEWPVVGRWAAGASDPADTKPEPGVQLLDAGPALAHRSYSPSDYRRSEPPAARLSGEPVRTVPLSRQWPVRNTPKPWIKSRSSC